MSASVLISNASFGGIFQVSNIPNMAAGRKEITRWFTAATVTSARSLSQSGGCVTFRIALSLSESTLDFILAQETLISLQGLHE